MSPDLSVNAHPYPLLLVVAARPLLAKKAAASATTVNETRSNAPLAQRRGRAGLVGDRTREERARAYAERTGLSPGSTSAGASL
jgi:hypothetical protein